MKHGVILSKILIPEAGHTGHVARRVFHQKEQKWNIGLLVKTNVPITFRNKQPFHCVLSLSVCREVRFIETKSKSYCNHD